MSTQSSKPFVIESRIKFFEQGAFLEEPAWQIWKRYETKEQRDQGFTSLNSRYPFLEFRLKDNVND